MLADTLWAMLRQPADFLCQAGPIKRNMLTGLAGLVPVKAIGIYCIGRNLAPGRHLPRSYF